MRSQLTNRCWSIVDSIKESIKESIKKSLKESIKESIKEVEPSLSGINQGWNQLRTFTVLIKSCIKRNQAATPGPLTECRSDTHLDTLSAE